MEIRLPLAVGVVMALAYGGFTGTPPGQDVAAACRSAARGASAAEVRGAIGTCRENGRGEVGADAVTRGTTSPGPSLGPSVVAPPKTPVDVTDPVTGRDAPES